MSSRNQPPEGFPETFGTDLTVRDIDLDSEVFYVGGEPLTEQRAAELVERAERRVEGGGRPSLTAPGTHSPALNLRVSQVTKDELEHLAASLGKRQSDIVREALEEYFARRRGA